MPSSRLWRKTSQILVNLLKSLGPSITVDSLILIYLIFDQQHRPRVSITRGDRRKLLLRHRHKLPQLLVAPDDRLYNINLALIEHWLCMIQQVHAANASLVHRQQVAMTDRVHSTVLSYEVVKMSGC